MPHQLTVSVGQHSDKGRKESNQDFHGACIPKEPLLTAKGIAVALADGISSSQVSHIASEAAVAGFLEDYFCTSETWSVKKSAQTVLTAINSWLHSQTLQSQHRYEKDKGYVCTLSAIVVKSTTAHILHVGDSRVYRLRDKELEQLSEDHRLWVSREQSYLSRALGMTPHIEIDYRALPVERGDVFVLTTDGVHEHVSNEFIVATIQEYAPDEAARRIVDEAHANESGDNLTVQILRIEDLPDQEAGEIYQQLTALPCPPVLEARASFDGYTIIRELHGSSRSHVYLAIDEESGDQVIIKTPSIDMRDDPAYLERFVMEEWIARRINNAHVLKPCPQTRQRNYLYLVTEFIDGQTLAQWMIDHPKPDVETVRGIVEQIARGLFAFHRMEMVHQDLRPENIMIDNTGTVRIIDFGSARVAGIMEMATPIVQHNILGTAQYTAPEYFLGETGSASADLFSLGVITYQMLSGRLPYGAQVARSHTRAAQKKLRYRSLLADDRDIPAWIDEAIKKAVHPDPRKRYEELSEFLYDLRHPNRAFLNRTRPPLMERDPVLFWKGTSFFLLLVVVILLLRLQSG
ncbi:MAG TPA: bifunctional protein-serine/threonine kinase/phosphatase [Gammaproteobacteria bacterium]|nr:bifunctional protein-serine/threonine kinase/phosphatase [Gammaproteobacteria bacterium]